MSFPQEIASFPFYSTFHQILMAGVNANQAAQLSYLRNLQQIAFKPSPPSSSKLPNHPVVFDFNGDLNYVEFNSDLLVQDPNPAYTDWANKSTAYKNWLNAGSPAAVPPAVNPVDPGPAPTPMYFDRTVKKHIKVPLLAVVDIRPMAIDHITADLSIKLKSEFSKTDTSQFKFDQSIDVGLDLGFLNVKSHTEISYQQSSSQTQGTTREYNLEVHMDASTQPLNAPLKNIIDYLIRAN